MTFWEEMLQGPGSCLRFFRLQMALVVPFTAWLMVTAYRSALQQQQRLGAHPALIRKYSFEIMAAQVPSKTC